MTTELGLPVLRKDQSEIVMHPTARIRVVACGRRWGKTVMGITVGVGAAAQGFPIAWVVPSHANAGVLWNEIELATAHLRAKKVMRINRNDHLISFPNTGGSLRVYSADSSLLAMRGSYFAVVICDESAYIPETDITRVILPTLADLRGDLYLFSTPNGQENHFYRWYMKGLKDGEYVASWRYTALDNPNENIRAEYWQQKEILPAYEWETEWNSTFLESGASVFPGIRECATAIPQDAAIDGHLYIVSADLARAEGGDNSVFSVIDLSTEPKSLVHQTVLNGKDFPYQIEVLKGLYRRFNAVSLTVEANSVGIPVIEEIEKDQSIRVQRFWTVNSTKQSIVDGVALALANRQIAIIPDEDLISEMLGFHASKLPSGLWKFQGMGRDDRVMSLCIGWYAASSGDAGEDYSTSEIYGLYPRRPLGEHATRGMFRRPVVPY